jgi:hypothetical protein
MAPPAAPASAATIARTEALFRDLSMIVLMAAPDRVSLSAPGNAQP